MPFVDDFMNRNIIKIKSGQTGLDAAIFMTKNKVSSLLVVNNDNIVGIITEKDLIRKVVALNQNINTVTVESFMSSPILYIKSNSTLRECVLMMKENKVNHLVVSSNDKVLGIITLSDIMPFMI
tara:strand:- start:172 stop:543 length:372 start_codon:yes stop_codon:yes gene_type:complete